MFELVLGVLVWYLRDLELESRYELRVFRPRFSKSITSLGKNFPFKNSTGPDRKKFCFSFPNKWDYFIYQTVFLPRVYQSLKDYISRKYVQTLPLCTLLPITFFLITTAYKRLLQRLNNSCRESINKFKNVKII